MSSLSLKAPVSLQDHHRGPLGAPVILVEYGDFECRFCGQAYFEIERLLRDVKNNICFVFRHFPLSEIHPHAFRAAMAAEAADQQNSFWPMHHLLFQNQSSLSEAGIVQLAQILKLDMKRFQRDLHRPDLEERVRADFNAGIRSGVNGTPTLFLNGVRFEGSTMYESLREEVNKILASSLGETSAMRGSAV